MQAVKDHPYVDQVMAPLQGESDVGDSLAEDPVMEYLENEVMKVGSLAHTGIDWGKVESESLRLLSDVSKDLKVLGFLMLCLQRDGNGERFAVSFFLLQRVLDDWWDQAWPYPGDRGQRARKMLFRQILQRALKQVESLSFDGTLGDARAFCLETLDVLLSRSELRQLPSDGLADLKRAVEKLPVPQQAPPAQEAPLPADTPSAPLAKGTEKQSAATASIGSLNFDPTNERAARQSLLKVSDLLTDHSPEDPLGYQLRRYAIWHSITAVPPTRDGVKTDLAAVSADRVADYRDALDRSPDLALWQRIEQSLSVSPFWLDGHYLSACVALELGYPDCAESIRASVRAFVERLPKLTDITFNDGTPFLTDTARDWVFAGPTGSPGGAEGSASPWESAYREARILLDKKGLTTALQLLEDGLEKAREPRDRFYWRLMSSQLLRDCGMKSLARQQIQDLQSQVSELNLSLWEPGLMTKLDRLA